MQLTAFYKASLPLLLFLAALGAGIAPAAAQQNQSQTVPPRITLQEKNASLKKVFNDISRKTGYSVMYDEALVKGMGTVTFDLKDAPLSQVLYACTGGNGLGFTIEGNTITISKGLVAASHRVNDFINIVGKVTDENGAPLSGVTISIKGTGFILATLSTGEFSMGGAPERGVILFTCIGYNPLQISYTTGTNFNVRLVKRVTEMGSVSVEVNNGYQILPLERTTGSYDLIDNKLFNRSISPDLMDHLNGVASGVYFDNRQQGIGAAITSYLNQGNIQTFSIRGLSTINSNNLPLVVIDGFPYNPTVPYDQNINNLNPNDIESMTVLKDAAAASIWGARAGNGVLVITTKAGKYNQAPKVSASASVTVYGKPRLFTQRLLSSADYILIEDSVYQQGGFDQLLNPSTANGKPVSQVVDILSQVSNGTLSQADANAQLSALSKYDNRSDALKYLYRTGTNQAYNVQLSGGSATSNYRFSGGYDDGKSVDFSYQKRFTLSGTYNFRPYKGVELSIPVTITNNQLGSNYGTNSGVLSGVAPYSRLVDASGHPQNVVYGNGYNEGFIQTALADGLYDMEYNPINQFRAPQYNHSSNNLVQITPSLKYTWKGLTAMVTYQYSRTTVNQRIYASDSIWSIKNNINDYTQIQPDGSLQYPINRGGELTINNNESVTNDIRTTLGYDHLLAPEHRLSVYGGYERNEIQVNGSTQGWYGYNPATGTVQSVVDYVTYWPQTNYILANYPYNITSTVYPLSGGISGGFTALISSFGTLGYSYKNRYNLTGSARIDQANLFGVNANAKKSPQWSAGLKWDINKEPFYKAKWLPLLDLRATYGVQGNLPSSGVTSLTTIQYYPSTTYSGGVPSANLLSPPNPNLTWEKVAISNLAVDFATKNNILSGKLEYYFKHESGLVVQYPTDPTSGVSSLYGNVGAMKGTGIDLTLDSRNITTRSFQWTTHFLFSHNTDKLTNYNVATTATQLLQDQANSSTAPAVPTAILGNAAYGIYSLRWGGLDAQGNPQGYDTTGKLSEDYTQLTSYMRLKDLVYHGSGRPTYFGSFMNNFEYKRFLLSVNITYNLGYYFHVQSVNYSNLLGYGQSPVLYVGDGSSDFEKRWQKPGDEKRTYVPSMPTLANNNYQRDEFYQFSSVNVQNAGNVRLRDISLGYDFTSMMPKRTPFSSVQLHGYYVSNKILWTANKLGIDPDFSAMKPAANYSLGLNLGLK